MVRASQLGLIFPVKEEQHYDCEPTANYEMFTLPRRKDSCEDITSKKYKTWSAVQGAYLDMYLTERIVDLKILAYKTGSNKFINKLRCIFSRK